MDRENSYEYAANVKDKVKRLEAKVNKSPGQNSVSNMGVRPPPTKNQTNKAELNNSSETLNFVGSSAAAVMDVEITQLNSPHFPTAAPKVSVNGSNFESDSDTDIDPPISVKNLLRRFSAGMTHTFRKKSPDRENGESSNKAGVATNSLLVPRGVVDLDDSTEKNTAPEGIGIPRSKSVSHKQKPTAVLAKKSAQNIANVPNKDAEILTAKTTIQRRGSGTTTHKVPISKKTPSSTSFEGTQSSFALSKLLHFQRSSKKQNESEQQEDDPESKVPQHQNKIIQNGVTGSMAVNGRELQDVISTNEQLKPFPPSNTDAPVVTPFENETSEKSFIKNEKEVNNNSNSQVVPKPKPRVDKQPVEDKVQHEKGVQDSLTMQTEIILVVGPSRAGKSSIINHILHQDLSTIYKSRPSEREIVQCVANSKSKTGSHLQEELSSSLVLIDTPGFTSDKMGAAMWSTLLQHLDNSSTPLDPKPPSLILVVVSEAETTSFVESDEFQNFCKALSHYCTNSFMGFSKIVFVVTYSAPLDIAASRLAIERLSILARPYFPVRVCFHRIMHTKEKDLSSNILTSTRPDLLAGLRSFCTNDNKGDNTVPTTGMTKHHETHPVLKHVFATDYPKTITECFVSKRVSLKSIEHPDTLKTYKILQNLYQNVIIEPTEISTLLEIGWENVNNSLRKKYPSALLVIQQVMQRCKIRTFSDLPEDPMNIFQLLKNIPQHNPAIADLLIETLQLKVPSCYAALYIGQGYDVSKDAVTHVSPFQLSGALKTSPVGLIPNEIGCKLTEDREIIFKFFCTLEEYALDRFKDLAIKHVTFPKSGPPVTLTANQKIGYNIVKPNQEPTKTTTATSNVEYRAFQLSLSRGEEIEFKQQFWDTISSLPELNIKDPETVDCWSEFFKYWGTHIVKAAHAGGSIQVTFRGKILSKIFKSIYQKSEILTDELETSRVFQWLTGDGLDFARPQNAKIEFMQGCDVDTSFHGGDMRFQQTDLTKLDHDKVSSTREEWIQSLPGNPLILETNLVLVPISYFVRQKSEGIATKMDVAFLHFYSNFIGSQAKQSNCSIL